MQLAVSSKKQQTANCLLGMRKKIKGYILQFTRSDHEGRHIHVYKDDTEIGVYDREEGPIRGLEGEMNRGLRDALEEFRKELNERGF